jgi:replicative DNA helicase
VKDVILTLLRSVIDIEGTVSPENLVANFQRLKDAKLEFVRLEDQKIVDYLKTYFAQHVELPQLPTLTDYFERTSELEAVERLKDVASAPPLIRTGYAHLIAGVREEQNRQNALLILKEAQQIVLQGVEYGSGADRVKKVGVRDAISHISERAADLVTHEHNARLEGNFRDDGQAVWDEYQNAKANKHLAWGKFCGLNAIDSVCRGIKRGELWVHAGYTGELKCLPGDATVYDHRTQRRRRLKEMFASGEVPIVTAVENEGKGKNLVVVPADVLAQNGEREVFDLTLASGRTVGATSNHKFLTLEGWKELSDLREGDFIATPKIMRAEGAHHHSLEEVKLVGYLIGDGRIQECINFTQANDAIREDFLQCLRALGLQEGEADYEIPHFTVEFPEERVPYVRVAQGLGSKRGGVISPVRVLLENLGLYGKDSYTKRVPSEFFGLTDDLIEAFLGALWSTDGSCSTGTYKRPRDGGEQAAYTITYPSVSHGLCLDVQSLLLRLGIASTVTHIDTTLEDGRPYRSWVTRVVTNYGKREFCRRVRVVGKEERFANLLGVIPERDTSLVPSSLLPEGNARIRVNNYWRYANNHRARDTVTGDVATLFGVDTGDIVWDRVRSVTFRGVEMTYDLSVPGHHTFVTNDIVTHNTVFAMNWAYNLVTRYRSNVAYISLEMKYEDLRLMIYVMHSANAKFKMRGFRPLDYGKVRDGELDTEEELFYQEVIRDFTSDPTYGSFKTWRPADLDVTVDDIKLQAELYHKQEELGLLVIDHSGLVEPRKKKRNKDYGVEINSVIRDMKKLALNFNAGEGIGLLLLHQINRQGKDEADKNQGQYKAKALAYANEAEKSADVITTTWLDNDHRRDGTTVFSNLKNRSNRMIEPFLASIDFSCRRLSNLDPLGPGNGMSVDDNRSAIEGMFT